MKTTITYVSDWQNLGRVRESLDKYTLFGIDTETYGAKKNDGLDPLVGKIRLVQISNVERTFVLDMQHLPKAPVAEFLLPMLASPRLVKVMHNGKFDLEFMATYFGLDLRTVRALFCTRVAHKLVKGGLPVGSKLKDVAYDCCTLEMDKSEQTYDWGKPFYKEQLIYAALDAAALIPSYRQLCEAINANNLQRVGILEMDCLPAVAQLELNGIRVDRQKWMDMAERDKDQLHLIEHSLRHEFGFGDVNLNSDPQMWKLLSDMTGLNIKSRAKGMIAELIENYEETIDLFGVRRDYRPALLKYLEYSDYAKDVSTYGFSFLEHIHPVTGRIHSNFNQNDTNTQRFSSSQPNLQNIPRDSERRAAFIPADGHKFIGYDYSQFELRILAQFTNDRYFCDAFANKVDVHAVNAALQYGVPFEEVTAQMRQDIKPVNFGVPYGLGADGLAAKLGIERDDAKRRLKKYYADHPDIVRWHNGQFRYFKTYNCVRTPSGRVRALPHWKRNDTEEFKAMQASKNFPIQSTNADAMKLWITRVFHKYPEAALVNTVHDEGLWEVPEAVAEELSPLIKEEGRLAAEEVVPNIPITLEGGIHDCWMK